MKLPLIHAPLCLLFGSQGFLHGDPSAQLLGGELLTLRDTPGAVLATALMKSPPTPDQSCFVCGANC